jgi:hypothetical protein
MGALIILNPDKKSGPLIHDPERRLDRPAHRPLQEEGLHPRRLEKSMLRHGGLGLFATEREIA